LLFLQSVHSSPLTDRCRTYSIHLPDLDLCHLLHHRP
jgi:hypothetical protein